MTKGKILREYAVTVEHRDGRLYVSWDGKAQYSTMQDGWTTEYGAIREAAYFLLDTVGCWVEVVAEPLHQDEERSPRPTVGTTLPTYNGWSWTKGAGHYTMRLRVKG